MTPVETMLETMLRRDEGEKLKVYMDTLGHPTIGIGRALDTQGITKAESDYLLFGDISRVERLANDSFPWFGKLTVERQAVLLSMLFQLGGKGVLEFRGFLAAAERGDWSLAAAEMRDSKWHREDSPARAERLAVQMETGVYQA